MVTFTDDLWSSISHNHKAILDHPFLTGLTDGTLPEAVFRHYVLQDAHYLIDYARALAVVAGRAPDADAIVQFSQDAAGAILAERSLHAGFIADFGLTAAEAAAVPVLPTTRAYTSYILSVAHQASFADAVAAVLPCYWIYARVGAELLQASSVNPLYARWIDTYGGAEFQAIVASVLALVNRLGPQLTAAERDRFTEHVATTSRYEWMFWDAAWRGEQWPVELANPAAR
jgi:thiaminase/transcriptional activator TenA